MKRAISCMLRVAALLAAAAIPLAASAASVTIAFSTPGTRPSGSKPVVTVHAQSESGTAVEATLPLAKGGTMALAPGLWELSPTAPGFWSQPSTVRVADSPTATTLTLFPAVTLRGAIDTTAKTPRTLTIHFQPTPSDAPSPLPASWVECPVSSKRWRCDVPAGVLDLAFRAPGFVSLYRWNQRLTGTEGHDLGTLPLRRGASLSGSVSFAERIVKPPKINVAVWQEASLPQTPDRKDRDRLTRQTATPNARGFFDLTVAPGSYTIQATAGELISEPREVRVIDGRESMLRDPLVLERPRTFALQVTPPVDPLKKQWSAVLQKLDRNRVVENEVSGTIPPSGRWEKTSLTPGRYLLSIRRTPNDIWYSEEFVLTGDETRNVKLNLGPVKGTLTLAGKPLQGTIWFGGDHGQPRIPILTHEDGTFSVLLPLPEHDLWREVTVTSETPYVNRSLTDVAVQRHEGKASTVDIDLPSTLLLGTVVDREGVVKRNAIVEISTADGGTQQYLSENGSFSISGLPPGRTALRADTREDESDGPQEVEVRGEDATTINLIVKPRSVYDGLVTSADGPVRSAAVTALPLDFRFRNVGRFPADEEGHFTLPLPPGTVDSHLFVSAPGYAFRMLRAQKPKEGPLLVLMAPQGGALTVESPQRDAGDLLPVVLHNGAALPALTLGWLADGESGPNGEHGFRILYPSIEEGLYAVCWMTLASAGTGAPNAGRCATGLLPRGGSLTLTAPAP